MAKGYAILEGCDASLGWQRAERLALQVGLPVEDLKPDDIPPRKPGRALIGPPHGTRDRHCRVHAFGFLPVTQLGAVEAVTVRRASLLPAGITAVDGTFVAGDPVDLIDQNSRVIARGLVNFDARELPALLGRSTRELARERGPEYEREVVHRDDMVVWSQ